MNAVAFECSTLKIRAYLGEIILSSRALLSWLSRDRAISMQNLHIQIRDNDSTVI